MVDGRLEHVLQLVLVFGRHDDEIRNRAHVGKIENAMVGRTIGAHQSAAVQSKNHVEILQADIV